MHHCKVQYIPQNCISYSCSVFNSGTCSCTAQTYRRPRDQFVFRGALYIDDHVTSLILRFKTLCFECFIMIMIKYGKRRTTIACIPDQCSNHTKINFKSIKYLSNNDFKALAN